MDQHLDIVDFHLAKKLKDNGFDWECKHFYDVNDKYRTGYRLCGSIFKVKNKRKAISAPNVEIVNKWLRDVHGLNISIHPEYYKNGINWNVQITWFLPKKSFTKYNVNDGTYLYGDNAEFKTYEDALLFGIDESVKIIDITKTNFCPSCGSKKNRNDKSIIKPNKCLECNFKW